MRRITYAGTTFYTGDEIAEALFAYSRALARKSTSDTVFVPGRTSHGEEDPIEVLVGPASQLVSEPADIPGPEIEDADFVARLEELTMSLGPLKATVEPAGTIDLDGFDELS